MEMRKSASIPSALPEGQLRSQQQQKTSGLASWTTTMPRLIQGALMLLTVPVRGQRSQQGMVHHQVLLADVQALMQHKHVSSIPLPAAASSAGDYMWTA